MKKRFFASGGDILTIMKGALWALLVAGFLAPVWGQEQTLSALAKLDPARSGLQDEGGGIALELGISQPVPWRVRLRADPARVIVDFRELDWTGLALMPLESERILSMRAGVFRPGWSRLVLELSEPMTVVSSEMVTDGAAVVRLTLAPIDEAAFAQMAARPEPEAWALPVPADLPPPTRSAGGPLVVVLDPGHGGIDPGAERGGQTEADLMLTFARELKELLLRDGGFEVVMTRESDVFVPLEARVSAARAAGADVFLSLHADALAEGEAVGSTIYTLSEEASDVASAALAERHDRDDLLAGVDLRAQDDLVASVLMDMARTETIPRTDRLATALEVAIKGAGVQMHRQPKQKAGFSVLKSPDTPSLLLELGFLSSAEDLARLQNGAWRSQMAGALRDGLRAWADEDASLRDLR